jgi:hypothetical protein
LICAHIGGFTGWKFAAFVGQFVEKDNFAGRLVLWIIAGVSSYIYNAIAYGVMGTG